MSSHQQSKQRTEEQQPKQEQDPWNEYRHHYHIQEEDNNQRLNEIIITLRLTKKHYKTAYTLADLLGHKSFDDYVSHIVVQNLEMEVRGGDIDIDQSKVF
jgi:hypothetical protein